MFYSFVSDADNLWSFSFVNTKCFSGRDSRLPPPNSFSTCALSGIAVVVSGTSNAYSAPPRPSVC